MWGKRNPFLFITGGKVNWCIYYGNQYRGSSKPKSKTAIGASHTILEYTPEGP